MATQKIKSSQSQPQDKKKRSGTKPWDVLKDRKWSSRKGGFATKGTSKAKPTVVFSGKAHVALSGELARDEAGIDVLETAERLEVELPDLVKMLNVNPTALLKASDVQELQASLAPIKRILDILEQVLRNPVSIRAWLNAPHPELDGKTPKEAILDGYADAVCGMLENAIQGIPA